MLDKNIFKLVKNKIDNLYKNNFNFIVVIIFLIRFSYIFFNENSIGDLPFYSDIVNGILNNCGIGTISNSGECSPIVGHYFPGFFYLIALSFISGAGVKGLVILISIFGFFSSLFLAFSIKKYTNNINLAKSTFILISLSPMTLGWTRLILMEPLITNIGICLISLSIQIFYEGFNKKNFLILLVLQIFSIYIKPTSILFSIPILILAINKLRLISLIYFSITWFLIISISIAPWGVRNLNVGANRPFESVYNSNFIPENTEGYLKWMQSWIITEHEQAVNGFQIWKNPMNLSFKKSPFNPFIKDREISKLKEKYKEVNQFSSADNQFFMELSKQRKEKLSTPGHIMLYSAKIISLMINPLNSWGWPIAIWSELYDNFKDNITLLFNPKFFVPVYSKIFLFFYRLIFFLIVFASYIKILINKRLSIFKTNSFTNFLGLNSLLFFAGIIYLIVFKYPNLEHRLISIVIPWMEVYFLFFIFKFKNLFLSFDKYTKV